MAQDRRGTSAGDLYGNSVQHNTQTDIMRVLHERRERKEASVRSTVMYWDNVMISSWQMDTAKLAYTRHMCANSALNLRDVTYSCDLYIQIMLCSMETPWDHTVYILYKVVALNVHVFSFKILFQQPR
jgi:hypothetical protein